MKPFRIDADIARASTPPSQLYHDPDAYAQQREQIFARAWHVAGDADRLKAPGRVVPFTLLPGSLDEPLVLTRDQEGAARCLSNVCTHRGALVVEGEGHQNGLRCRYHGRRFGLDGCFQHMPEFEGVEGFPSASDDLPRLPLHQLGPLLFTSLDPLMPFEEWIAPVIARTGGLPLERYTFDAAASRDYLMSCHWALYVENYLEEFHIPYVHGRSLSGKLDYDAYRTELFDWCSVQIGPGKGDEPSFDLPSGHPDAGMGIAGWYFWLFPNLMLNFYPWGLSVNIVQPLGPGRTRVSFLTYVHDASLRGMGAGGDLHRVEMEDEEVVESVQRGVRSRLYDRGRYSPRRETGTHHFHSLLARVLNGST
ncbi:MAG TPA: aromatic ring-hydroxylating dioxygenase subunit alpha [Longimicrobiales bacterium]|nr:aromatic ring-hydroxylating dioxygenase subunit alpha [Longimicrobiales bacterium]